MLLKPLAMALTAHRGIHIVALQRCGCKDSVIGDQKSHACNQAQPMYICMLLQVASLFDRAQASEAAAERAEEDASVAMRSAETGVREEMEAAAVVKETESALTKALAELTFLETSYEEKDFESKAEKVKAKEKAQKQAEAAVKDALAAVNASVTGPAVDGAVGKFLQLQCLSEPCNCCLTGLTGCCTH